MTSQNINSFRRLLGDGDGDLTSRGLREDGGKTILDDRLEAKTILDYEDGDGVEEQKTARVSIDETATLLQQIRKINDY